MKCINCNGKGEVSAEISDDLIFSGVCTICNGTGVMPANLERTWNLRTSGGYTIQRKEYVLDNNNDQSQV